MAKQEIELSQISDTELKDWEMHERIADETTRREDPAAQIIRLKAENRLLREANADYVERLFELLKT